METPNRQPLPADGHGQSGLTPQQEGFVDDLITVSGQPLPKLTNPPPRNSDNEIELPIDMICDAFGRSMGAIIGPTGATLAGVGDKYVDMDEIPVVFRHNDMYLTPTAIIDPNSRMPHVRFCIIDIGEREKTAMALADLDAAMKREPTDLNTILDALPAVISHPIHSGTPGEKKYPIKSIQDLIPTRSEADAELHRKGIKGEGVPYPIHRPDGTLSGYYVETDPARIEILSNPGDYHVYEIALLARCKNPSVLAKHPFPVGYEGAEGITDGSRFKKLSEEKRAEHFRYFYRELAF